LQAHNIGTKGYKSIGNRREVMAALKLILNIAFIIICIALTILILMQEGKSAGLGAIAGAAETYWGKNKGRSMEGMLVKITRVLVILFILIACVLNIGSF
jgi:preprotein translocase subunit SecG